MHLDYGIIWADLESLHEKGFRFDCSPSTEVENS